MALRRRSTDRHVPQRGMIDELERLLRRARALPLILPVLLFGGWGLGMLTHRGIALPADADFRIAAAAHTPVTRLETLSQYMAAIREDGSDTEDYVVLYRNHVQPVEESLERWGVRGELRMRSIDPWVGTTADWGLGVTRRF